MYEFEQKMVKFNLQSTQQQQLKKRRKSTKLLVKPSETTKKTRNISFSDWCLTTLPKGNYPEVRVQSLPMSFRTEVLPLPVDSNGFQWVPVDSSGFRWISLDSIGFHWPIITTIITIITIKNYMKNSLRFA